LKQAIEELTSRRADLPLSEQFLKADVRSATRDAVQEARQGVADLRVDREVSAADGFESLLNSAFQDAQSVAAHRHEEERDERDEPGLTDAQKSRDRDVDFARHELTRFLTNKPELTKQLYAANSQEAKSLLASLEEAIRKSEDVSGPAAQQVISDLSKQLDEIRGEPLMHLPSSSPVVDAISEYLGG
jgi:hypothetical protein